MKTNSIMLVLYDVLKKLIAESGLFLTVITPSTYKTHGLNL